MNEINVNKDITINLKWKDKQLKAIKELYEFKEEIANKCLLLNEPYVYKINKQLTEVKNKLTDVYNLLIPICQYHDDINIYNL